MLASSISQGSGAGWLGVLCRGPTWLAAQLLHLAIAADIAFIMSISQAIVH